MKIAASKLVGRHDFRNFCKMDVVAVQNFERTIHSIDISLVNANDSYINATLLINFSVKAKHIKCMY